MTLRTWFLSAAIFGAGFSTASAEEFTTPRTIDPGLEQSVGLKHDQPFLVLFQASADRAFDSAYSFPVLPSQPDGNDHSVVLSFDTPWDIDSSLKDVFFRAIFLDLATDRASETETRQVEVGHGDRVYESIWEHGLFVVEMEWNRPIEDWKLETGDKGYAGDGYLVWRGGNNYGNKNNGRLDYEFNVEKGGTYRLLLHSFHWGGHENNDVWVQIDDLGWEKVYCYVDGAWSFETEVDPGSKSYKVDLSPGRHTLKFAARSQKFKIDRFHLFNLDRYAKSDVDDVSIPNSTFYYED